MGPDQGAAQGPPPGPGGRPVARGDEPGHRVAVGVHPEHRSQLLGHAIDLAAPTRPGSEELQSITPALVAGTSLVTALAGWGLLALLERFTARPRTIWTAIAVLVGLLSLAGPLSTIASTTVANGLGWPSCTWPSPRC